MTYTINIFGETFLDVKEADILDEALAKARGALYSLYAEVVEVRLNESNDLVREWSRKDLGAKARFD